MSLPPNNNTDIHTLSGVGSCSNVFNESLAEDLSRWFITHGTTNEAKNSLLCILRNHLRDANLLNDIRTLRNTPTKVSRVSKGDVDELSFLIHNEYLETFPSDTGIRFRNFNSVQ